MCLIVIGPFVRDAECSYSSADQQLLADMDEVAGLLQTGAGIDVPRDSTRLCILLDKDNVNAGLYLRIDVDDESSVRDLRWLDPAQAVTQSPIYPEWGPPDVYSVTWWNVQEMVGTADGIRYFLPRMLSPSAIACVVERDGKASVFLEVPAEVTDYSPEFHAFLESYPVVVPLVMPMNSHAYGGCCRKERQSPQ